MTARNRLLEIFTSAGLADKDLAVERAKGQRESNSNQAWLSALTTGVNAAGSVATKGLELNDADAAQRAKNAVGRNAFDLGDDALTPEEVAESNLAGDKELAAPKKTGGIDDFFADPFGVVSGARERASRNAQGELASRVGAGRKEAGEKAKAEKLAVDRMTAEQRAREAAAATSLVFYVDTLEHLRRGGRIGAAAALLGTALAVKPLLHVADGRIAPLEKVRTASKALARLEALAVERAGEDAVDLAVHHLAAAEKAEELAGRLRARVPGLQELHTSEVGAVVGAHVGPGLLGVVVSPR